MESLILSHKSSTAPPNVSYYLSDNWFGNKSFLKPDLNREFADNTLHKAKLLKTLKAKKLKSLKIQHEKITQQVNNTRILHQKLIDFNKNVKAYSSRLQSYEVLMCQLNASALKIQKVFRGHLARKQQEDIIIELAKSKIDKQLSLIRKNDMFLTFYVGKRSVQSLIQIQRFFRRVLYIEKLKRWGRAYTLMLESNELQLAQSLSRYFILFKARDFLKVAKEAKALSQKLLRIRKNLAILTVKKLLKRLKLKLRTIKHRVRRYSRRFGTQLIIPLVQQTTAAIQSPLALSPRGPIINEVRTPQDELIEIKVVNIPNAIDKQSASSEEYWVTGCARQDRVAKGLISYNVNKKKSQEYLPLFIDYDPDARPRTTRSTTHRINLSQPMRIPPKRVTQIPQQDWSYKAKACKKYTVLDTPPYMKETKNSIMRYEDTPSPVPNTSAKKKCTENKILYPTFSFNQKAKPYEPQAPPSTVHSFRRPSTGPTMKKSRMRNGSSVEINVIEPLFNPPSVIELSIYETHQFRPLFVKKKLVSKKQANRSDYSF